MFTGLVQDIGTIVAIAAGSTTRLTIGSAMAAQEIVLGESIAVDGVCLTVVAADARSFQVEASPETLQRTTVGAFTVGARVHLERALRLADRLGGHLVLGHVDAVSSVISKKPEGGALVLAISLGAAWAPMVIEKGSVAIDGISLTVNKVESDRFSISMIPETQRRCLLGNKPVGARVNVETDIIGKYVARLMGKEVAAGQAKLSEDLIRRCFA